MFLVRLAKKVMENLMFFPPTYPKTQDQLDEIPGNNAHIITTTSFQGTVTVYVEEHN
jgi:hypothetical protein